MDITQIKREVEALLPKAVEALGVLLDSEEPKSSDIKLTFDLAKLLGVSLIDGPEASTQKSTGANLGVLENFRRTANG
jgi:hypothetical protein